MFHYCELPDGSIVTGQTRGEAYSNYRAAMGRDPDPALECGGDQQEKENQLITAGATNDA